MLLEYNNFEYFSVNGGVYSEILRCCWNTTTLNTSLSMGSNSISCGSINCSGTLTCGTLSCSCFSLASLSSPTITGSSTVNQTSATYLLLVHRLDLCIHTDNLLM